MQLYQTLNYVKSMQKNHQQVIISNYSVLVPLFAELSTLSYPLDKKMKKDTFQKASMKQFWQTDLQTVEVHTWQWVVAFQLAQGIVRSGPSPVAPLVVGSVPVSARRNPVRVRSNLQVHQI